MRLQREQGEAVKDVESVCAETISIEADEKDDAMDEQLIRQAKETLKNINTQYR